jgi:hypothetical protein
MRSRWSIFAVMCVCAIVLAHPRAAFAQQAPAVVEPPPPKPRSGAAQTVELTGYLLTGLGTLTLLASGIVWLNAAAIASRLDDECPNNRCVEGSDGAESLESARDAEQAADVLVGISLPVITAGFVMIMYTGGFSKRKMAIHAAPVVSARSAGGSVAVSF